ncbi:MAG: hypothetical protein GY906_17935 [bacterium]|nr:hypothetical protein [bacterium]
MNTARKGAQREHKTLALLRAQGYQAIRAPASKGMFDVWAVDSTGLYPIVRYIQVKSGKWVYGDELAALEDFAVNNPGASVEMWRWDNYARAPKVRVFTAGRWVGAEAEIHKHRFTRHDDGAMEM